MSYVFGNAHGTVKAFSLQPAIPAVLKISNLSSTKLAVTSVGFGKDANAQFMHTLGGYVYVYAFGQRIGMIDINGVVFMRYCDTGGDGLSAIMNFYDNYNIGDHDAIVTVTIGTTSIFPLRGLLRSLRSTFSDASTGVLGFTLTLALPPTGA